MDEAAVQRQACEETETSGGQEGRSDILLVRGEIIKWIQTCVFNAHKPPHTTAPGFKPTTILRGNRNNCCYVFVRKCVFFFFI